MIVPLRLGLSPVTATRYINQLAEAGQVNWVDTVYASMDENGLSSVDVNRILREGQVHDEPFRDHHRNWQAQVEKRLQGGERFAVAAVALCNNYVHVRYTFWRT